LTESITRMSAGSWFQALGPATANDRAPKWQYCQCADNYFTQNFQENVLHRNCNIIKISVKMLREIRIPRNIYCTPPTKQANIT